MELETWQAPPGDTIPNHPRFPVLIYRGAGVADAAAARALYAEHGWGGTWVDGVFAFHHFHSNAHEALSVIAGRATLELGGPQGEAFEVSAGDVLVLPAGTGHRRGGAAGGGAGGGGRVRRRRRLPGGSGGLRPAARGRRRRAGADRRRRAAFGGSRGRRGPR